MKMAKKRLTKEDIEEAKIQEIVDKFENGYYDRLTAGDKYNVDRPIEELLPIPKEGETLVIKNDFDASLYKLLYVSPWECGLRDCEVTAESIRIIKEAIDDYYANNKQTINISSDDDVDDIDSYEVIDGSLRDDQLIESLSKKLGKKKGKK